MIRGKSSSRKGKDDHGRSKFRVDFRDLKKNLYTFCKELEHWKIDCPRIKEKKESKPDVNFAYVVSIQDGTSQVGGSDPDSSVFSFFVTTLIVGYLADSE